MLFSGANLCHSHCPHHKSLIFSFYMYATKTTSPMRTCRMRLIIFPKKMCISLLNHLVLQSPAHDGGNLRNEARGNLSLPLIVRMPVRTHVVLLRHHVLQ